MYCWWWFHSVLALREMGKHLWNPCKILHVLRSFGPSNKKTLRWEGFWLHWNLVGGWTNPSEKYYIVKLDHETPRFGVKMKKYLSCHHLGNDMKCQVVWWSQPLVTLHWSLWLSFPFQQHFLGTCPPCWVAAERRRSQQLKSKFPGKGWLARRGWLLKDQKTLFFLLVTKYYVMSS